MSVIRKHNLSRMLVKTNKSISDGIRRQKTNLTKFIRQSHSKAINLVRGKGIDPYAVQMIALNVIPEHQYQWFDHSDKELKQFISALKIVPSFLEGSGQMISVKKDKDVSCEVVWEAIMRTLAKRGSGGNSLSHFMLSADNASSIELEITDSNNRVVIPKVGKIIFDKFGLKGEMADHFKQLNASKTANIAKKEARHILTDAGKTQQQTEDYLKSNRDHIKAVIKSYFQLEALNYHPGLAKKIVRDLEPEQRKGFLKLFDKDVDQERVSKNIVFLKKLFMQVPPNIILPTIVYHDIGKDGANDREHGKMGAELFASVDLKDKFGVDVSSLYGKANKVIIMNSIRHHLVPGGLAMGEFSFGHLAKFFNEQTLSTLLNSGKLGLFIDNITLLTACDMAGYVKSFVPLNFRIESLMLINSLLKKVAANVETKRSRILTYGGRLSRDMISEIEIVDKYSLYIMQEELKKASEKMVKMRIARMLACDDILMDKNTDKGLDQYIQKLDQGIAKAGLSYYEIKLLLKLFSSVTDYSHSSRVNSFFLWGKNIKELGGVKFNRDKVNENALRFFVHVARIANIHNETQVKMMFVRSDGSLMPNYNNYWNEFVALLDNINKGNFEESLKVTTEIVGSEKTIKIHLPDIRKK